MFFSILDHSAVLFSDLDHSVSVAKSFSAHSSSFLPKTIQTDSPWSNKNIAGRKHGQVDGWIDFKQMDGTTDGGTFKKAFGQSDRGKAMQTNS